MEADFAFQGAVVLYFGVAVAEDFGNLIAASVTRLARPGKTGPKGPLV
jgi:hypothetical protein